jgi:hypothetical protein
MNAPLQSALFDSRTSYADSPIMPRHESTHTTVGRISVPGRLDCRHYQRASRNASNGSGGL